MKTPQNHINIITELFQDLFETHQDKLDHNHHDDLTCSYCPHIIEAQLYLEAHGINTHQLVDRPDLLLVASIMTCAMQQ